MNLRYKHLRLRRIRQALRTLKKQKVLGKRLRLKERLLVLEAYGGACACCGETAYEFLALDHVDGDGARHKEQVYSIYKDVIRRGFPNTFRLLCHNCNSAMGFYGYCPHSDGSLIDRLLQQ